MNIMDTLEALLPRAEPEQLQALVELAEAEFRAECRRDDVPEAAQGIIVRMVQQRWNRLDSDGLAAESWSGASETYLNDWPEDLKRAMHRYRKAGFA